MISQETLNEFSLETTTTFREMLKTAIPDWVRVKKTTRSQVQRSVQHNGLVLIEGGQETPFYVVSTRFIYEPTGKRELPRKEVIDRRLQDLWQDFVNEAYEARERNSKLTGLDRRELMNILVMTPPQVWAEVRDANLLMGAYAVLGFQEEYNQK